MKVGDEDQSGQGSISLEIVALEKEKTMCGMVDRFSKGRIYRGGELNPFYHIL